MEKQREFDQQPGEGDFPVRDARAELLDAADYRLYQVRNVCAFFEQLAANIGDTGRGQVDELNAEAIAVTFEFLGEQIDATREDFRVGRAGAGPRSRPRWPSRPAAGRSRKRTASE